MIKVVIQGVLYSQVIIFSSLANDSGSFGVTGQFTVRAGNVESCPSPLDIKNKDGVFTAPANTQRARWAGVIVDGDFDYVVKFEKAMFFLLETKPFKQGLLNSCVYMTFAGKQLDLRLDFERPNKSLMRLGESSWRHSQEFSSPSVVECSDQFRDACRFSLLPSNAKTES
ncbi:DUF3757 domain-containing protein [Pseudomonas sp. WS 5412]|uniref:DUF3757 domain-containing protein n=1 Tax=Pseudomonas sp. WS 5412 TaxID=2717487 RepID=UPI0014736EE6|nr:DUF3757 domain-containing protein [Pseudomonas sp. WS 5412]NMY30672.1 DUF3757 domain-containing protein [Pseudomonas sp. WS 5412]